MEEGDSTTRLGAQIQCTVLGESIPAGLRSILEHRGWRSRAVSDPVIAMIEIARHERTERARCGWGVCRKDASALIVPDPGREGDIESLCAALARYLPDVIVMRYRQGQLEPWRKNSAIEANITPAPGRNGGVENDEPIETQVDGCAREDADDGDHRDGRTTLSRAELDMLLNSSAEESSS